MKRLMLCVAAFTAGCGGPAYAPEITLNQARPIIDATAEWHDLYPAPALVSGKERFGLDAPDAAPLTPTALTDRVQTELWTALRGAGVFTHVARFDAHPDFVLAGRINALQERYRPRVWTKIPGVDPIADVLDLKTHVSSGEADLTLFVLTPKGEVVGRYRGRSSFDETFNPTDETPPGARLNRALSDAVQQIQEQLLRDAHLRTVASR